MDCNHIAGSYPGLYICSLPLAKDLSSNSCVLCIVSVHTHAPRSCLRHQKYEDE